MWDWEYPGPEGPEQTTNRPEDKVNCTAFPGRRRRAALGQGWQRPPASAYLLTMATGTNGSWIEHTEMDKIHSLA